MNLPGSAGSGGAGLSPALTNASAMVRDNTAAATDAGGSRAPRAWRSATCRATCGNRRARPTPGPAPAALGEPTPDSAHFRDCGTVPGRRRAGSRLRPRGRPVRACSGKPLVGSVPPAPGLPPPQQRAFGPQQVVRRGVKVTCFPSATTLFKVLTLQNVNCPVLTTLSVCLLYGFVSWPAINKLPL